MAHSRGVYTLSYTRTQSCTHKVMHSLLPFRCLFHHFSIFISVIYSKSIAVSHTHIHTQKEKRRGKKHCKFTALGNSCCNIYCKDHSKILKMCHHGHSAPASVTICFLLKHYTQKESSLLTCRCYFKPFFFSSSSFFFSPDLLNLRGTALAHTNILLSPAVLKSTSS